MAEKPRLVVALLADDQEFQRLQADDARGAALHAGFDVQVLFAENSPIMQIQQLFKVIHVPDGQRPKAIIVETVVGEGLGRVASAAARAGVGWIIVNRKVPYLQGLRQEYPLLPIAAVGTDQVEVGRIQARQFLALIPPGRGTVLYVQGPVDTSAAQERLQGAREVLAGGSVDLKVIDGQWTEASGEEAVQRWLRLKSSEDIRPDLVGCQNDAMAVGVRKAIATWKARPELGKLPVTGCDGLPDGGQRLVNMGQLAATVITPSNTGPAIEAVARALKTGQQPPAEVLLKPSSYPPEAELARRFASRRVTD